MVVIGARTMVPIKGMTGELYGALVVTGHMVWSEAEKHLVASFAHQLGGTLEVQRMRKRLAEAEERRLAKREEMQERGIATLLVCPACGRCYDHTVTSCEEDAAGLEATRLLPYRIADRYRLSKFLGEGGMGAVFKAEDEKLSRFVSIKIIKAELLDDPFMRMRISREARLIAQIQHPGVVSIYDFGEVPDGSAFIVMEFLQGLDLAEVLKRAGPGTPQEVATVLTQVGDALYTTHTLGVIHRDLKPANLFVVPSSSGFQVKVLDFGLAKSIGEDVSLTVSGMLVGTPAYMSPEQIRGQALNGQSDLYSLACVAYELLSGQRPFDAENIPDILTKVLLDCADPLSSKLPGAPAQLESIFFEALKKDPGERPKTLSLWIEQIVPILMKTPSSVSGWRLETLLKVQQKN